MNVWRILLVLKILKGKIDEKLSLIDNFLLKFNWVELSKYDVIIYK